VDDIGDGERRAKDTVQAIYGEAADEEDEDRRKALAAHAAKSEDAKRIHAMSSLARSERGIPTRPVRLNNGAWVLNCPNGTLDLRTGELRPHRREDYLTNLCPVPYDPQARCPLWERFLTQIFPAAGGRAEFEGDADLIAYVRRFCGYCLTGLV